MVILDEPVSALDKSVEAQVLNLLRALKRQFNLTYVFISHDLNVVRYISDRVLVMYLGRVVEIGPGRRHLFAAPSIPTRRALLSSRLSMDPDDRIDEPPITGDPPNPIDPPSGCRFHTRCPFAEDVCVEKTPAIGTWVDARPISPPATCSIRSRGTAAPASRRDRAAGSPGGDRDQCLTSGSTRWPFNSRPPTQMRKCCQGRPGRSPRFAT